MKKGDVLEIKISGINEKALSFGYYENEKVFVNINAAKDQIVKGILRKTRKKKYELFNCEIIDYANRTNSMYEQLDKQCSGSNYQYYSYEEQKNLKKDIVKQQLDRVIKNEYIFDGIIESVEKEKYRNKMEFSFGNEYKDGPCILGLHKKNSFHDIVDVSYCKLMDDNFNKIYMATNEWVKKYNLSFYHRLDHIGYLRNLVIRKASNQILVNLVTTSQYDGNGYLDEYMQMLLNLKLDNDFKITGILHTINDKLADSVYSEKEYILYGKRDIEEKLMDLKFKISPYSFFQTNTKTVEKLYSKAMEYVQDNTNIALDLFSGTGTIGQILSKKSKKVYGIEIVEEAVKKANESAMINNIDNCSFIAGDVFEKIDELEKADIAVIDPPRAGIGEKTIEKIVKYEMQNLVYISCNPKTLAEDLKVFQERGYIVKRLAFVDMFPFTNHVETICLMSRIKD